MAASILLHPFGLPVALYLGLAGVAGGAGLAGALLLGSRDGERARLGGHALLLALFAVTVGALALVLDLDRPGRFWMILAYANPRSVIAWGARILTLFVLVGGVAWLFGSARRDDGSPTPGARALLFLCALLAVLLAVYPVFVLRQATARPLWQGPALVPLYGLSGLHAGFASLAWLPGRTGRLLVDDPPARQWEGMWIALEALLLGVFVWEWGRAGTGGVRELLTGGGCVWLWGGVVVTGLAVPLALALRSGLSRPRSLCVVAGCFALRGWLLFAGQDPARLLGH